MTRFIYTAVFCIMQTTGILFADTADSSLINTSHLDHLYEKITLAGRQMAIIHIYADAPDYKWTDAPGEGIACVDDAARAAIFYLRLHSISNDTLSLQKARFLLEFVLYMQADNGLFYNFILSDYSINKTRQNSVAKADWWSWRALWALSEAFRYFSKSIDARLSGRLEKSLLAGFKSLNFLDDNYPKTTNIRGIKLPEWLPYKYASDQAAVIIMALVPYLEVTGDTLAAHYIKLLAKGIMIMQSGDEKTFPFYAHLSWENSWHGWGSNQSEALLLAGIALKKENFINSALREIKSFYPYLIKQNYLSEFSVYNEKPEKLLQFPQIAYGINPMASAAVLAFNVTRDPKYAEIAADILLWLFGKNITGKSLYNPKNGRCFDGIESVDKINVSSGAESTIEALMALLNVEQVPICRKIIFDYLNGMKQD